MIKQENFDFQNTPVSSHRLILPYQLKDDNHLPVVSIIMPYFNTGHLFRDTAASILRQSFQQWEWIIVNDGSTDQEALGVLDEYRNFDPRIKIIDLEKNQGVSAARNIAFDKAQCEYVVQMDSDDLLEPTTIEKFYWFMETHPEYAFVNAHIIGFQAEQYLWPRGFFEEEVFLRENLVTPIGMIRKAVWKECGKYNENRKGGLEDWEFWLQCADHGYWGGEVTEFLQWYRRRETHSDRWESWTDNGTKEFLEEMKKRFSKLYEKGNFPKIPKREHLPKATVSLAYPNVNQLDKENQRVLMIFPWLEMGGADKFNLDLIDQLQKRNWEVSIVTTLQSTNNWELEFYKRTPDIFILDRFLELVDYPKFLLYLIASRDFDVVLVSNSEFGYMMLPVLRAFFPDKAFVDYSHIEEEHWNNGGHPRSGINYQHMLDLNGVTSEHLKNWMVKRGAEADRIYKCYINVDTEYWAPDANVRKEVRNYYDIHDEEIVLFYAARICPQKKPDVFIKTILKLKNAGLSFKAVVAGDGEDFPWLKAFVEEHQLHDVVYLLGAVSSQEVNRLMKASDIFFLSSQWEGIALSIYEAMASGLVVVSSDVGGQKELVVDTCGYLINPDKNDKEVEAYFEILKNLLENKALVQNIGESARKRVLAGFQLDQMGENMQLMFNNAIKLSRETPRQNVSKEIASIVANDVVEHVRLIRFSEHLWGETQKFSAIKKIVNSNKVTRKAFETAKPTLLKTLNRFSNFKNKFFPGDGENRKIKKLKQWNRELEEAKKWLEVENRNKDKYINELQNWIQELETAKKWLEAENKKQKR